MKRLLVPSCVRPRRDDVSRIETASAGRRSISKKHQRLEDNTGRGKPNTARVSQATWATAEPRTNLLGEAHQLGDQISPKKSAAEMRDPVPVRLNSEVHARSAAAVPQHRNAKETTRASAPSMQRSTLFPDLLLPGLARAQVGGAGHGRFSGVPRNRTRKEGRKERALAGAGLEVEPGAAAWGHGTGKPQPSRAYYSYANGHGSRRRPRLAVGWFQ